MTAGFEILHPHSPFSVNTSESFAFALNLDLNENASITTDYEKRWPKGIHREYWLNVTSKTISPDGYLKPEGKVANGTYPGPVIEACWGDDITIHVTNYVPTNGTTIHWHGVRQLHSNAADGVNGLTQCPIATGESFTYNFKATQYGHSWYHSHYSLQYPDGVAGPLLIHGPTSANWDEEFEPIFISDWVHDSAFAVFHEELLGVPPPVQTVLLGGIGSPKFLAAVSANGVLQVISHVLRLTHDAFRRKRESQSSLRSFRKANDIFST